MTKKKQTRLDFVLAAVDKFSAPMKRFNKRMDESFRGLKKIQKASSNLKRESGWNKLAYRAGQVRKRLGAVGSEVRAISQRIAAAVGVAVGGILAVTTSTATAGDRIAKTALRLGLSTDALQEMHYWAQRSGVEMATYDMAYQRFGRRVGEAFMGKGEALSTLKALEIQLAGTNGKLRDSDDLFMEAADKLARIEDPMIRNAMAMKLFDSEGVKLVQMMKGGRKEMEAMRKEAHKYGQVLSGPTTEASENYIDAMTNIKSAISGVKNILGEEFMPMITYQGKKLTAFLVENQPQIRAWIREFVIELPMALGKIRSFASDLYDKLSPIFSLVGRIADVVGPANLLLGTLAVILGTNLVMALAALIPVMFTFGTALALTPVGWFIAAVAGIVTLATLIVANWEKVAPFFKGLWEYFKMLFGWNPITLLINNWGPIVGFFKSTVDKIKSVMPDWLLDMVGSDSSMTVNGGSGRPSLGAADMTRSIRESRSVSQSTQRQETVVKVKFEDTPRGTRVETGGDAPLDLDMGYAMVTW
ncbi:MAG: hypothetical protein JEY79_05590 [Pseudodesulfovibrio sp.]|nr:hypothetical protein [Pseudodesulfovibrio sp.]